MEKVKIGLLALLVLYIGYQFYLGWSEKTPSNSFGQGDYEGAKGEIEKIKNSKK